MLFCCLYIYNSIWPMSAAIVLDQKEKNLLSPWSGFSNANLGVNTRLCHLVCVCPDEVSWAEGFVIQR